jgi:RNA polymerase sigma factor (TIGR02999 family)
MGDVSSILQAIERGEPAAAEQLLPLVYDELRKLAAHKLAREQPGQTLQATALVHEAWLRLAGQEPAQDWNSRGHFFAAAAEAMRRILIERARQKQGVARGGRMRRIELHENAAAAPEAPEDLLAIDEALARLEQHDPTAAAIVKLRFFGGLTLPQAAEVMGISLRTVERNWTYARTWLHRELAAGDA